MKFTLHKAGSRGHANHGWLITWHTFSFANYYNPNRMHFGALRVLNDDTVQAGMGFGMHPHDNMEIITMVLEGDLEHRDSMGNGSVIRQGEVQVMSAGTGVHHSEFCHSKTQPVKLLQIWVFPDTKNVEPRYAQAGFSKQEMQNQWRLVVSPDGEQNSLWIYQKAWFWMGTFHGGTTTELKLRKPGNGIYLFVISGEVTVEDQTLKARDGLGMENIEQAILLDVKEEAQLLAMEIPINYR